MKKHNYLYLWGDIMVYLLGDAIGRAFLCKDENGQVVETDDLSNEGILAFKTIEEATNTYYTLCDQDNYSMYYGSIFKVTKQKISYVKDIYYRGSKREPVKS